MLKMWKFILVNGHQPTRHMLSQELRACPPRQPKVQIEPKRFSIFQPPILLSSLENWSATLKCQLWVCLTCRFLENGVQFSLYVLSVGNWTDSPKQSNFCPSGLQRLLTGSMLSVSAWTRLPVFCMSPSPHLRVSVCMSVFILNVGGCSQLLAANWRHLPISGNGGKKSFKKNKKKAALRGLLMTVYCF